MELTTPSDTEILITETFEAPQETLFACWTDPDLIRQWMFVPAYPLSACEVDLQVGGEMRLLWRSPMPFMTIGLRGTFLEIDAPNKLVHEETFDDDWTNDKTLVTTTFSDCGDGTAEVAQLIGYKNQRTRDEVLSSPMKNGIEDNYRNLKRLLPTL